MIRLRAAARHALERVTFSVTMARVRLAMRLNGLDGVSEILPSLSSSHCLAVLRSLGASVDTGTEILSPLIIHNARGSYANLRVGQHCHLGRDLFLDLRSTVEIADRVVVSMRTTILTHMDVGSGPLRELGWTVRSSPVRIAFGAYIGAGSIILPGVEIGAQSIVGAGAVVTKSVPPNSVAAGVPAKIIRTLLDSDFDHPASGGGTLGGKR